MGVVSSHLVGCHQWLLLHSGYYGEGCIISPRWLSLVIIVDTMMGAVSSHLAGYYCWLLLHSGYYGGGGIISPCWLLSLVIIVVTMVGAVSSHLAGYHSGYYGGDGIISSRWLLVLITTQWLLWWGCYHLTLLVIIVVTIVGMVSSHLAGYHHWLS